MEYTDSIMEQYQQVAIGNYSKKPVIGMMLAQVNREAEQKVMKTGKLSFTAVDGANQSSLERASFVMIGLAATAEQKANNVMSVKLLKNRDESLDIASNDTVTLLPQFAYIGDMEDADDEESIYSTDVAKKLIKSSLLDDVLS